MGAATLSGKRSAALPTRRQEARRENAQLCVDASSDGGGCNAGLCTAEPIVKKAAAEIFFMTIAALGFEDLLPSAGLSLTVYAVPDRGGRCLSRGRRADRSAQDEERHENSE